MSRVQLLNSAARSPVAKFHELRLKYWNPGLDVVCCFEGGDDVEFYLPHVRQGLGIQQERVGFVNCGGKGVVLSLWRLANGWNLARVGFFVDRDLDDFISGNENGRQLYVTDEYSIESNAVGPGFFNSVWQEIFRLPFDDARYATWSQSFQQGGERVAKFLLPVLYTALAIKRQGGGVEFDNVDMSRFYAVGARGEVLRRVPNPRIDYSRVFFGSVNGVQLRAARAVLKAEPNFRLWLRGKAALVFSMTFFARMKQSLGAKGPNRCKVRVNFNDDFAISCLCARTQRPASFDAFLTSWRQLIVANGAVPV